MSKIFLTLAVSWGSLSPALLLPQPAAAAVVLVALLERSRWQTLITNPKDLLLEKVH
jgi:hypothetical protein